MDQWVLFLAPGHPALKVALEMAVKKINNVMEKEVADMHELVLTTTGPKLFMAAVEGAKKGKGFSLRETHEDYDSTCEWKVLGFRDKTLDEFTPKTEAVYYWDADKGTVFASERYRKRGMGK